MSSAQLDALYEIPIDPVSAAHQRATACLLRLRDGFGGWEGEVVWCPVITAQAVITLHVIRHPVEAAWRRLVLKQFAVTQHEAGGWGLHPASQPYRFVTTLVYVASRLLGEPATSPRLQRARAWLDGAPGDVYALPSWGKFWLFVLGLYDRDGLNPCPPELFLLPDWVPFAPNRLYCHTRYIYLGMATVLAGPQGDAGPLGLELRAELGLDGRNTAAHRHDLADTDAYVRPGRLLRAAYDALRMAGAVWRRLPGAAALRRRAVAHCRSRIAAEQRATRYQALSPVNGLLNTLALHQAGMPEAVESVVALGAWAWSDETAGLRYAGARSATWDTALAVQALLAPAHSPVGTAGALRLAHRRLASMQERAELPADADEGRQSVLGGWCFSDGTHRWPVSDCTAEALSAILLCEACPGLVPPAERLPRARIREALVFLLARQNDDGGFGTYERRRGGSFLERLNPSEMFGDCMTELSYVECTASALRALHHALEHVPETASSIGGLADAAERAQAFLLRRQGPDGAWPGFWGINYVYGTYFAVAGLRASGLAPEHPALVRAAEWLRSIQRTDGGWGEHFSGCLEHRYVAAEASLVITTSWAVLALASAEVSPSEATQRGAQWLADQQRPDGDWERDGVNGVFFGTAMLDYRLYNTVFPTWALARMDA